MAGLSIIFSAVDEISNKFDKMMSAGDKVTDTFEQLSAVADASYSTISDSVTESVEAMEKATQATDYWTEAIENYDKEIMEATYSTEELVYMGLKTEDALTEAADSVEKAAEEIEKYGEESEKAGKESKQFGDKSTDAITSLNSLIASAGIAIALEKIGEKFAECSVAAAEFEVSVAKVTTVADTMVLSADELSSQISGLSTDMAKDVNEIADSAYNAISAGVDTAMAVETVGTATELSVAGFTGVSSSLSVLTTALNAYKLENDELTNVSDSLVMSQNLGVLTIDQLSSSIGKAISTASAYSIDLYNLESGYISLTKAGIGVDEATTYISSMFGELGDSGSAVAQVIRDETGKSFGELMQSGQSLGDVLSIVYNSVNQNNEALMNLWGSAEAGKASNAIIGQGLDKFNENLITVKTSAGATERAYETMTNTAEYATERMANSFANMDIVIGEDLNPAVSNLKNGIADIVDEFTALIEKHPAISAILTGLVVGIGAVVVGITAYTVATTVATVANEAFGISLSAAIWPITLIVLAIAAVVASIVYLTDKINEANDVSDHLVTSSQNMEEELTSLQGEYDKAVEAYGRNSDEAYELKTQIDDLTDSFESSKRTIGDLTAEIESLDKSIAETYETYQNSITATGELQYSSEALIGQLAVLSDKSTHTDADLSAMQGIVDKLNGSYEGLNITLDETNGKINLSAQQLYAAVEEAANEANNQAATEGLVSTLQKYNQLKSDMDQAYTETDLAKEKYNQLKEDWVNEHPVLSVVGKDAEMNWSSDLGTAWTEMDKQSEAAALIRDSYDGCMEKITQYCETLGYSSEDTQAFITQLEGTGDAASGMADSLNESSEATVSAGDAFTNSVSGAQEEISGLVSAYDEAFNAARDSIDGQIGLFDTMKTESEQSVADMQAAMDSQIEYLNTYTENLQKASEFGLDEGMISSLSDGSAESAGQLDAIISKIEELGGTTEGLSQGAQAFVDSFNGSFTQVSEAKDTFAGTVAEMETDFSAGMDAIINELTYAVDKMDMSGEAASAAKSTMDAYINVIKTKTGEANAAMAALNFANKQFTVPGVTGTPAPAAAHAEGGIFDTPHYGVFAEAGPEAFIPIDGSQDAINIWENTGKMLGALPENESSNSGVYLAEQGGSNGYINSNVGDSSEKKVLIEIAGSGSIKVGSSEELKQQGDSLTTRVHDIIVSILQEEIFTEGDAAYEY